jgi:hypothetical protein
MFERAVQQSDVTQGKGIVVELILGADIAEQESNTQNNVEKKRFHVILATDSQYSFDHPDFLDINRNDRIAGNGRSPYAVARLTDLSMLLLLWFCDGQLQLTNELSPLSA